jgi:hypothetical protein
MKKLLAPLSAIALLLGPSSENLQAAPPLSPVGTWDCTLGGNQLGLAILRFDADFTFSGIQLVRPNPAVHLPRPVVDPRNGGGGTGRDGSTTADPSTTAATPTNFVGGTSMSGLWGYDTAGKVIGLLDQITATVQLVDKQITNVVNGTNMVTTVTVYETIFATNSVSFRAVVVPGQRLNLTAFLPFGQNSYRGMPSVPLPSLSGSLYGSGVRSKLQYFEFFAATPAGNFPNYYDLDGVGAGYSFTGFAIVSRQKRIAVFTGALPSSLITTYSGPFNLNTLRGNLKGRDSDGKGSTYKVVHQ